jgi:hypothetical protein
MSTARRSLLLVALVAAAGGLALATGAAVVDGPADTFADDRLAVQPVEGPNGAYAYLNDDDEIVVDVSASNPKLPADFEGVNPGALASAEGVFTITYTADESARVWIEHENPNVTFVADGGSIEGESNAVSLGPNESVAVGLEVDARDAVAGTRLGGDAFDIRAELVEPESAPAVDPGDGGDDADAGGGAATTVRRPSATRREFEGSDLAAGDLTRFDAVAMPIAGDNVTLDRVTVRSAVDGDVRFETAGRPRPFPSAGPLTDSRGPVARGYFELNHSFTAEEVSLVRFGASVDRDYLNATGADPEDISVYRRDADAPDGWERLETERVDPAVRRLLDLPDDRVHVTAATDEFSVFAVATERPVVRATTASLAATAVDPGEPVTVTATVANEGGRDGVREVTLTADGDPIATERVDLAPGETASVAFRATFDDPGVYDLAVGDAPAGTLAVGDPDGGGDPDGDGSAEGDGDGSADGDGDATNRANAGAEPPTEEPSGVDLSNLVGLLVLAVLVVASVALVRRMPRP